MRFLDRTQNTIFGRTRLDRPASETIHNIHKTQASMLPAGFELSIPASEQPQTHATFRNTQDGELRFVQLVFMKRN